MRLAECSFGHAIACLATSSSSNSNNNNGTQPNPEPVAPTPELLDTVAGQVPEAEGVDLSAAMVVILTKW